MGFTVSHGLQIVEEKYIWEISAVPFFLTGFTSVSAFSSISVKKILRRRISFHVPVPVPLPLVLTSTLAILPPSLRSFPPARSLY